MFTNTLRCFAGLGGPNALEILMQNLTFTCPETGRAVDTGITTDCRSLSSVQTVMMRLNCPYCGMAHRFPIKRGYLAQPSYWPSMRILQTDRFACRPGKQRNQPLPNQALLINPDIRCQISGPRAG